MPTSFSFFNLVSGKSTPMMRDRVPVPYLNVYAGYCRGRTIIILLTILISEWATIKCHPLTIHNKNIHLNCLKAGVLADGRSNY